jgi:L-ascorbate metabolism protein UlaG (beta-lactamase superfamily)
MKIITNTSVGNTLDSLGITCEILEHGESLEYESILVEGFGNEHAEIFGDFSATQNTGYFIDNKMFYPGDAFTDPGKPVSILAVPVSAPWMALKEAINYVADLKPGRCFPVHDGVLSAEGIEIYHRILEKNISKEITFASLRNGGELYIM